MLPPIDPVAIVTGGSYGIGREISRALASQGYAIAMVYLLDQSEAEAVVQEILTAHGTALAIRANTTDLLDVERLFTETIAAFGGIHVVVHASQRDGSVVDQQAARWLRRGGAIVHVAGSHVIGPVLANELRARNITVDQVALGSGSPRARDLADLISLLDRWREQGD